MGSDPGDLYALCEELLVACEEALNIIPNTQPDLDGAPTRSFIAPGRPAADCCPQLTVHSVQVIEDQLGAAVQGRSYMTTRMNQVTLAVTLFRCAPTEVTPPVLELEAASQQHEADGWALWNHIYNLVRQELLFSTCGEVIFGALQSLEPQGGCVGWFWPIQIRLDGFEETLSS